MRKHKISLLLIVTVIFFAYTIGFFMGMNQNQNRITVSVSESFLTMPTEAAQPATAPTEEKTEIVFPISINQATKEEFMALPGIGEVLAGRILNYREEQGGFSSVEELLQVEGLGKKRMEEIMDLITIGG